MENSEDFVARFFMFGIIGCEPTIKRQIVDQKSLYQRGQISQREYVERVAKLVTEKPLVAELSVYCKMQAAAWILTLLAAVLHSGA